MHFFITTRKEKLAKSGKQVRALWSTCEAICHFSLFLENFLNRQRQQARWATL
jgi:hypothetical protein